jgi:CheY-like chemotaxis protein
MRAPLFTFAGLIELVLREEGLNFVLQRVDNRPAFIRALKEFAPDIVLSDYRLPTYSG